jgi:hypothetical protein
MRVVVEERSQGKFGGLLRTVPVKKLKIVLSLFLSLIIFPAFLLLINLISFSFTKEIVYAKNFKVSNVYFFLILKSSEASAYFINAYSNTPLIKYLYMPVNNLSEVFIESDKIAYAKTSLLLAIDMIIKNSISNQNYNLDETKSAALADVQTIIEEEGFRETRIRDIKDDLALKNFDVAGFLDVYPDTESLKKYKIIVEGLADTLGVVKERNYVLVFQDNQVIRPTGGKISSLVVLSFKDGRLENSTFFLPEDIDNKIPGEVKPPYPLDETYKSWSFSDANWSSDIVLAAKQVEWFLESSLGREFDGVIFVDRKFISGDDFKKAIEIFSGLTTEERLKILSSLLQRSNKNTSFHLNNTEDNRMLEMVGLTRPELVKSCNSCFSDFLGIVESDLDGNGYNKGIERDAQLDLSLQGAVVKKKLTILFRRKFEDAKTHKIYLRFIAPRDFSFSPITIDGNKDIGKQFLFDEYRELGTVVDFEAGYNEKKVEIEMEGQINGHDITSYNFNWISQPGVINFYSKLGLELYNLKDVSISSNESLTRVRERYYNTDLVLLNKDIEAGVYFK